MQMRRRWFEFDWSIALVLSLILHAALVWWMLRDQVLALARSLMAGLTSPPVVAVAATDPDDRGRLGDPTGSGTAIAPTPGDVDAQGMTDAIDQPFLSRDPAGLGKVGDKPSPYTGPTGGAMSAAMREADEESPALPQPTLPTQGPRAPQQPVAKNAKPAEDSATASAADTLNGPAKGVIAETPKKVDTPADKPTGDHTTSAAAAQPAPAPPTPPAAKPVTVAAAMPTPANQPGLPMRSADPAPQADSEIDPFSKKPSVIFRAGKMTVQAGRKAKLTRPQLTLAGFWDGVALGHVEVTLRIVLDLDGSVKLAQVIKSSGSNEIDNPIQLEAYNWSFEPDRDAAGQPLPTEFPFTVAVFR